MVLIPTREKRKDYGLIVTDSISKEEPGLLVAGSFFSKIFSIGKKLAKPVLGLIKKHVAPKLIEKASDFASKKISQHISNPYLHDLTQKGLSQAKSFAIKKTRGGKIKINFVR